LDHASEELSKNGGYATYEIIQTDNHPAYIIAGSDGHGTDGERCIGTISPDSLKQDVSFISVELSENFSGRT
jgi:hypothetical protein